MPELSPLHWLLAALAAVLVGAAKTGVPGLGILAVPLMMWAVDGGLPGKAPGPGALLPLLCLADVLAVWWYRRQAAANRLWGLTPWVVIGLVAGALVMHRASPAALRALVGGIVLAMVALHLWRRRRGEVAVGHRPLHHLAFGLAAGFATMVAHAAGPVMSLYLLSMALPKAEFIGTGAWFFLVINLLKVPWYGLDGLITLPSLTLDLLLAPLVLAGCLGGRRVLDRIPQRGFEWTALALAALAAATLLWPR